MKEAKELLISLADLCDKVSDEVYEDGNTYSILVACDNLSNLIHGFLESD